VARSLSVLLPVKNAQSSLAPTVHKILDALSELSERIELLIIDDGSVDATSEVAVELTRHYPQVRAICQGRSLGPEAAIRAALKKSTGDIALIHEEQRGIPLDELINAIKTSSPKGQLFFRMDAAKSKQEIKPAQRSSSAAGFENVEHRLEQPPQISSRPARPNFLEKFKDIFMGE